jgi:choline dehydrogenase-like flavoprotein
MRSVDGDWSHDSTLGAIVARMVPEEATASTAQLGAVEFIASQFATDRTERMPALARAIDAIDAEAVAAHGAPFDRVPPQAQDELLRALAAGTTRREWSDDPVEAIDLLALLCAEGYYAAPRRDGSEPAGWAATGFQVLPDGARWPMPEAVPTPSVTFDDTAERYDAIIVGAGAGGATAAQVLSEAGMSVLLVERGESFSSEELPLDLLRSERSISGLPTKTGGDPVGDPRVVETSAGKAVVYPPDPRWSANAMTVGGGTRVYGAQTWRFSPEDFRMASTYGVPSGSSLADWPISYDVLEPWYDRAEWELGVSGEQGHDRFAGPRTRDYPMPPQTQTLDGSRLERGAATLGIRTGPVPLAINSVPYNGRPACVRCGLCVGYACHAGAKNGSFNTSLPRALATGRCALLTGVSAERILSDASGAAIGVGLVTAVDGGARRREVFADRIVVAAGAIESARLLLNSAHAAEPNGLGNTHDQVGRNLQAHVYAGAVALFDDVVQDGLGPGPSISTTDYRHNVPGIIGGGMIANDFVPTPLTVWNTLSTLGVIDRFGADSVRGMHKYLSRMAMVFGPIQEIPNPEARVRVDPDVLDRFGMPVALLSGDIHPEDRRAAAMLADRAAEWLEASGAARVFRMNADDRPEGPSGGQHQAGTCRMGDDPAVSVTDQWGRVWGHPNLLMADGSVHVTNGGVNPVLTIIALAYRNATKLAEEWRAERG